MRNVLLPIFLLLACLTVHAGQLPLTPSQTEASARLAKSYGSVPLSFERNQGQSDKAVKFISRGQGYTLFLTPTEAVLALRKGGPKPGVKEVMEGAGGGASISTGNVGTKKQSLPKPWRFGCG